jgi:hypothetical protein
MTADLHTNYNARRSRRACQNSGSITKPCGASRAVPASAVAPFLIRQASDFRSARSCHFVYPWRKSLISKIKTPKVEQANGFDSLPS